MYLFIINPLSGHGKALVAWNKIEKLLVEQQIPYIALSSFSISETTAFIAEQLLLTRINAVAIIGGDGTTSSIIQELAKTNTPIAIYPAGSGNDTARMFRLTDDPDKFVAELLNGRTTSIDLLKLNGHFGITVAGIGIDSIIGNRVNQSFYKPILNKLGIGSLAYTIASIISLLSFKPFNGHVTIDGEVYTLNKAWLIACGNTTSYGGGLNICPHALPTDGLLNVTLLHNVGRFKVLFRLFPSLLKGGPVYKNGVTYIEGKVITVESDRPIPAIVDGEIITSTPLQVKVHERALRLILTI